MELGIVGRVGGLMAEQVPVRPGIKPQLVDLPVKLPQREGDGTVRPAGLDGPHRLRHPVRGEPRVLAPLEYKGAKAPAIPLFAAVQNGVPVQPVAGHMMVVPPDAAVQTVIFADVAALDEPPDVDLFPVPPAAFRRRPVKEAGLVQGMAGGQQLPPLGPVQPPVLAQLVQQLTHWAAWSTPPCS